MAQLNFALSRNDAGQLLDGLSVLIEQWDGTAQYLRNGQTPDDNCIRECHDSREADAIAGHYRSIRDQIVDQIPVN